MKNSYAREPIGQLLKTIVDNRGKTVPTANDGIPLIATNCIKEERLYPTFENIRYVSEEVHRTWFRAHLKPDDILFVNKGTPGRVCMVPDPVTFCAAQDMIGLRADRSKIYPKYLFAFLRSEWVKEKIRNYHVGLVIPHFKKQDLDTITVPKRSDNEQKAIGDLYFLLSEKIELNNRINAELEGMAKLLYDYWFVQFDFPMTAAQATALGKPKLEGKPYRTSGGKMIYNETLKREIPEGWDICTVGEVLAKELRTKNVLSSKIAKQGKTPVIDQGSDFICGFTDDEESVINEMPKIVFGDHTRILKFINFPFARGADGTQILTSREKRLPQHLFYFQLLSVDLSNYGYARHFKFLKDQKVILPHQNVANAFEEIAEPPFSKIKNNIFQNQELTQLRDWLLPMLMNGQVTVN